MPPLKEVAFTGPTAEDIVNAGEMSAEERQDMVRGMVMRLENRLATEGGSPEEWARLISANGVLGDGDRAAQIWQNAKDVFADRPEALKMVLEAARTLGVTQ